VFNKRLINDIAPSPRLISMYTRRQTRKQEIDPVDAVDDTTGMGVDEMSGRSRISRMKRTIQCEQHATTAAASRDLLNGFVPASPGPDGVEVGSAAGDFSGSIRIIEVE
jgi:hypothetical protein